MLPPTVHLPSRGHPPFQARTEPFLGTLKISADYMGMRWGGELLGYANRPGDILADEKALAEAERFFALSG
ncbi:hypothetical protein GCM10023196_010230 [Actinoallomurus vinaceus]|uniref:Uncharacterized protein n=1 Tax=Actinoallomurus vinaceus TaxID=1080074 RepID=A0ABP8U4U9_9ACTN